MMKKREIYIALQRKYVCNAYIYLIKKKEKQQKRENTCLLLIPAESYSLRRLVTSYESLAIPVDTILHLCMLGGRR